MKNVKMGSNSDLVQPVPHSVINQGIVTRELVMRRYQINAPKVKSEMHHSVTNHANPAIEEMDLPVKSQKKVNRRIHTRCDLFFSVHCKWLLLLLESVVMSL